MSLSHLMLILAFQNEGIWVVDTYGDWVCRVTDRVCEISMTYHQDERLVHFRTRCQHSLTEHLPAMTVMLKALIQQDHRFDTLFIGRMLHYPEMARRLVHITADDELWAGYARGSAEAYAWIVETSNRERIFGELATAFDNLAMKLNVVSVEKVLSAQPENLPGDLGLGVKSESMLPYDALTWFEVVHE